MAQWCAQCVRRWHRLKEVVVEDDEEPLMCELCAVPTTHVRSSYRGKLNNEGERKDAGYSYNYDVDIHSDDHVDDESAGC